MTKGVVLLVDDDAAVRDALGQTLELADFSMISASSFVAAKSHITRAFQGVILSDIRMPGRDGFHLLSYARDIDKDLPVLLLTGEGDIPMALNAMEQGAFGFLEKPCDPAELVAALRRAMLRRGAALENRRHTATQQAGDAAQRMLFGISALSEELRERARLAARAEGPVLVTGAPGSGIYKVAEVIHLLSARAKRAFEKRAAANLSRADLAASLALAAGGSLFIDEITKLPEDTQIALLEALDRGAQARLIAGSATPLSAEIIHPDLFYRLDVMPVRIPSLAERPEDIPVLFRHYVRQASEQAGLAAPDISPERITNLMAQDWPGNARALMTVAMRFVLGLEDTDRPAQELGLVEQMAQVEQSLLVQALRRTEGQASAAASLLKLPRKTFYDKLAKYGIKPESFRR